MNEPKAQDLDSWLIALVIVWMCVFSYWFLKYKNDMLRLDNFKADFTVLRIVKK